MRFTQHLWAIPSALLLGSAVCAATTDVAGVMVDDVAMVGGTKLGLNGAGIFYKGPFKIYVGEMHTLKKVQSLDEVVAVGGPKRITMTFVRDVESSMLSKLMTRGMEDNVQKNEMSKLIPGLLRMSELFGIHKTFGRGDAIYLDWIPGTGLIISVKGKPQGDPFRDPAFFNALLAIFFGPAPASWQLKDQMLGIK